MTDPTLIDGPFIDGGGQMFVTVDDDTHERWLKEDIAACSEEIKAIRDQADADMMRVVEERNAIIEELGRFRRETGR